MCNVWSRGGLKYFDYRVPIGLPDVSGYPELFVALLDSGDWAVDELKKLAGLNFLRVFRAVEKVGRFSVFCKTPRPSN